MTATILYIDDDEGLRRLTRRALERRGYRVETASSKDEGVAMAAAERFDLVAVDHYMPGGDGLATLEALGRLDPPPPVIYVTGSDESRLAVAALKAGAIDYVLKAANAEYFDLLGEAIDQALAAVRLRAAHAQMEEELRQSNERLQSLLHEANHRVANSLQLVSSLVSLQARMVTDPAARAALDNTRQRIHAIARIHQRLYASASIRSVDMVPYLEALITELGESWSAPGAARAIRLQADPLELATEHAVALAIVVNELVTNACKYAYPPEHPGEIRVDLNSREGGFRLVVEDDGSGLSANTEPRGTGLGSRLVEAMASSLNGAITQEDNAPGLRIVLECSGVFTK
ncbi:MAG: response regulator [Sphingomonadales bacterium]|nr:response regulator [Sphingomonadales bacterium]